jgi:anti-anti-sigma regulatory factor
MATNTVWLKIDGEHVVHTLEEAIGKIQDGGGEAILDFSSVQRIDPGALRAMAGLANMMNGNASSIALRGVSVDVYKVLKLTQLASRFSFLS